jgi:hypothetical protein
MALADGGNIALSDRFASTTWAAVGIDTRSLDVLTRATSRSSTPARRSS